MGGGGAHSPLFQPASQLPVAWHSSAGECPLGPAPTELPPTRCRCWHSSGSGLSLMLQCLLSLGRSWKTPTRCPRMGVGQRNTAEGHFPDLGLPFPQAPKTGETCFRKRLVLITAWQLGWPIPGGGTSLQAGASLLPASCSLASDTSHLWLAASRPACFQFFWGVPLRLRSWTTRLSPGVSEQVSSPVYLWV